jgi:hypothetical protein
MIYFSEVSNNSILSKSINVPNTQNLLTFLRDTHRSQEQLRNIKSTKITKSLQGVVFATYSGRERKKAHCTSLTALFIDIDNKSKDETKFILMDEVHDYLVKKQITHVIIESVSSTKEKQKFHIIIPFDTPVIASTLIKTSTNFKFIYIDIKNDIFKDFEKYKLIEDPDITDHNVTDVSRQMYISGKDAKSKNYDGNYYVPKSIVEKTCKNIIEKEQKKLKDKQIANSANETIEIFNQKIGKTNHIMCVDFDGINKELDAKEVLIKLCNLLSIDYEDKGTYLVSGLFDSSEHKSTITYYDSKITILYNAERSAIDYPQLNSRSKYLSLSVLLKQILNCYKFTLSKARIVSYRTMLHYLLPEETVESFMPIFDDSNVEMYPIDIKLGYYVYKSKMFKGDTQVLRLNVLKILGALIELKKIDMVKAVYNDENDPPVIMYKEGKKLYTFNSQKFCDIMKEWVPKEAIAMILNTSYDDVVTYLTSLHELETLVLTKIPQYIKLRYDYIRIAKKGHKFDIERRLTPIEDLYFITHDFSNINENIDLRYLKDNIPTLRTIESEEDLRTLLKFIGSTLITYHTNKMYFFAIGSSNSGKTTLFENLKSVYKLESASSLLEFFNSNSMSRFDDSRICLVSEEDSANPSLNNSKVKSLTDPYVMLQEKYEKNKRSVRTWDYVITANNADFRLKLDDGLKQRIVLVNFNKSLIDVGQELGDSATFKYEKDLLVSMLLYGLEIFKEDNYTIQSADIKQRKFMTEFKFALNSYTKFIDEYMEPDLSFKEGGLDLETLYDFYRNSRFWSKKEIDYSLDNSFSYIYNAIGTIFTTENKQDTLKNYRDVDPKDKLPLKFKSDKIKMELIAKRR